MFAEKLCEPDGATPTRASASYMYNGQCSPMDIFDAGTPRDQGDHLHVTIHGPVFGTATVHGKPYALARNRSTFGQDGLSLGR